MTIFADKTAHMTDSFFHYDNSQNLKPITLILSPWCGFINRWIFDSGSPVRVKLLFTRPQSTIRNPLRYLLMEDGGRYCYAEYAVC